MGLVSSVLGLATIGASAKVFTQPLVRKHICGFLRPCILPVDIAPAVKRHPNRNAAEVKIAKPDRTAPELTDPVQIAVHEYLETVDLKRTRVKDSMDHLRIKLGEPTADMQLVWRATIVECLHARFADQDKVRKDAAKPRFSSVADIKAWIVEHLREADNEYGICLDGTVDYLNEEVAEDMGNQDDATQSRWRQWIIEESMRQDIGIVV